MEQRNSSEQPTWQPGNRLIPSLVLIGIGLIFLLGNLHIIYFQDWWRYWPVALIVLGLVKLVDSEHGGGRVAGGVLFGVGAIFLAQNLGILNVGWEELWPLILIGIGLLLLFERVSGRVTGWQHWNRGASSGSDTVNAVAVFGGGKRRIKTQNFRGGKVDAVFGGWEIDLREAAMTGDSAVLDANAVFGGVEIRIPESWSAQVRGAGVFGGYQDSTNHPSESQYPNPKRIIFTGAAVFGGVEIKN